MQNIFDETMVNMTYQEIEGLVRAGAVVLFPVAVIEEHGPHLPLGTDTYITCSMLKHIQNELKRLDIPSVIAPPFYWGINAATDAFPGSFTVKTETMKAVLTDTLECLLRWGFRSIYILNMHGDYLQNKTILEVSMEISKLHEGSGRVYHIIPGLYKAGDFKLEGCEACALFPAQEEKSREADAGPKEKSPFLDLHAGGFETSYMLLEFRELADEEKARSLKSSETDLEKFKVWRRGGERAREVTPLGYCGDPSNIDLENIRSYIDRFSKASAKLIAASLRK
jgi:creatinine amidohydrolase